MSTTAVFNSVPRVAEREAPPVDAGSAGWGLFASSFFSAFSFGILPAFIWPGQFRQIVEAESQRLRTAAEWAAGLSASPNGEAVLRAARGIRANGFLSIAAKLLALFTAVVLGMQFVDQPFSLDALLAYTFKFGHRVLIYGYDPQSRFDGWRHIRAVHTLWCAALSFAYAAQWVQVNLYRDAVRRFVRQFNHTIEAHGMLPVRMREPGGFRPLVLIGSIVAIQCSAWWGIPMLLAASAQSRYTLMTSRSLAVQFADRISRAVVERSVERRCAAQGCRALLPLPAKFCPQCGRPVPMIDRMG